MALITKKIKGTEDVLPKQSYRWQFIEKIMREESKAYGFKEIRTPVFEHTELFARGVGQTTDVVQKEMYTFTTKGGESVTLRPEGTAGAARAVLEHALDNEGLPIKASYFVSCYRYEKPQAGRLREFHQFGLEEYGTQSPAADAELICAAQSVLDRLGLDQIHLELNSIGCPECRAKYNQALREYFGQFKDRLCDTCLSRLEKNPMRLLDCKSPQDQELAKDAPKITDYLCEECENHFSEVKRYLDSAGVEYTVNPKIVRGLDYYTKTAFEFVTNSIGAQGTVCGGGRYDNLAEEVGGLPIPGVGFGLGKERLLMLMEANGVVIPQPAPCDALIATMGRNARLTGQKLMKDLREKGAKVQMDDLQRNFKGQFKYADRINARYTIVLGDNEIEKGAASLKNMETGDQVEVKFEDLFEAITK